MKKLVLILVCAFASFAFASSSSLEENNNTNTVGACDGYGGVVTLVITVACVDEPYTETINTCADQAEALVQMYKEFCSFE